MNGSEAGSLFSLKAYLTLMPFQVLILTFMVSLVVISFSIRAFEMCMQNENNNYTYVSNAFWLIVVTLTGSKSYPGIHLFSRIWRHSPRDSLGPSHLCRGMHLRCTLPFAIGRCPDEYDWLQSLGGTGLRVYSFRQENKG